MQSTKKDYEDQIEAKAKRIFEAFKNANNGEPIYKAFLQFPSRNLLKIQEIINIILLTRDENNEVVK